MSPITSIAAFPENEPATSEEIAHHLAIATQELPELDTDRKSRVSAAETQKRLDRTMSRLWLRDRGIPYPGMPAPEPERTPALLGPITQGIPNHSPTHKQVLKLTTESRDPAPKNIISEQALLTELLADNAQVELIVDEVSASDFYSGGNATILTEMLILHADGKAFDATIIIDALKTRGALGRAGGEEFIRGLESKRDQANGSAVSHARIIREEARRRALLDSLAKITWELREGKGTALDAAAKIASTIARVEETAEVEQEHLAVWPTMAQDAFHGVAGRIVKAIAPETEADPCLILGQLLAAFGNAIGRNAHFTVGPTRCYTNLFVVSIAGTGVGKGTAWNIVEWIMSLIAPDWKELCLKEGGLSTGEGLINEVRDEAVTDNAYLQGVDDKRAFFVEEEFVGLIEVMQRKGNTLNPFLRKAFDGKKLRSSPKNAPTTATNTHISVNGHCTFEELRATLSNRDKNNGFANRFLWLVGRRCNELPEGGNLLNLDFMDHAKALFKAMKFASKASHCVKPFHFNEQARDLWRKVYPSLTRERPLPLGPIVARGRSHVRKLAVIYAILDASETIKIEHLKAALAVWAYSEKSAGLIFGEAESDPLADKVLTMLRDAGDEGVSQNSIRRALFNKATSADAIAFLSTMERSGLIVSRKSATNGRPSIIWTLPYRFTLSESRCEKCDKGIPCSQHLDTKEVAKTTFRTFEGAISPRHKSI